MINTWLIGAGSMAKDYCKVLLAQGINFEVIGRGQVSAEIFEQSMNKKVLTGGVDSALLSRGAPRVAIVAVGIEALAGTCMSLMNAGTKKILLEKPGGLGISEIEVLAKKAHELGVEIRVAYNRRYYSSVDKVISLFNQDGGVTSCNFEFTEWSHVVRDSIVAPLVKDYWLLGNSSHVIDLAFYLCGNPADWSCWHSGSIDWHPSAARFSGGGITERGVMFSYLSDWEAPGRWGIEILTRKRRLILRPMEQLHQILLGSVKIERIELNDALDVQFKPGLFNEVKTFISGDDCRSPTILQQLVNIGIYSEMAGYK
jgi:predicted dehydrogenase